ncbi:hypothetical protein [Nocardioides stalactiti]|uniref:hypothetical protein n=1 Tax=Nocardioides stalactiti TaxID=2755356 RepID=UPI001600D340|nr:hypothetical protein [Nocardioides stalactiti]
MRPTTALRPLRNRRRARALAPVAVLALVAAVSTGCGDDDGGDEADTDDDAPAVTGPLTEEQIATAVLQSDNMGDGWTGAPATEDDTAAPGCFADLDALTEGLTKAARGGTDFTFGADSVPSVESTVTAYEDEAGITAIFDQVQTVIAACTTVTGPDGDGFEWNLTVATDDSEVFDDVDDQFGVTATGTITPPGGEAQEIHLAWSSVRVGPNVGSVTTFDVVDRTAEHATWAEIAVDRLTDVIEGEEPEATTAPAPA